MKLNKYLSLAHTPAYQSRFLLAIAGLGGLLYGIDVGIIAGALPYLEASAAHVWHLSSHQLGLIVAAVSLGSVLSSLVAGFVADQIGRRASMFVAGGLFSISIPIIAMAQGYTGLLCGRLLQGISGGLVGVVVPLYLAECLPPQVRGRGTALFQLMLTLGLAVAAAVGLFVAHDVELTALTAPHLLAQVQDEAWRKIFWLCLPPGVLFSLGVLGLSESPRWLLMRGHHEQARSALLRLHSAEVVSKELASMQYMPTQRGGLEEDSLLQRRYIVPFLLACAILVFNQATGINSIMAYAVTILQESGLKGALANWGDLALKVVNVLMTLLALIWVDRKGRRFLLLLGSGGIFLALSLGGLTFSLMEHSKRDIKDQLTPYMVDRGLQMNAVDLGAYIPPGHHIEISYSYGPSAQMLILQSGESLTIMPPPAPEGDSAIGAVLRKVHLNPFPDLSRASGAPLQLERVQVSGPPSTMQGVMILASLVLFVAFFAIGPGVCVWLALSELMPTRIRSSGMSIALLMNQFVSTLIAAVFLPTVAQYGYGAMFTVWATCTSLYFVLVLFCLPETKGKSLEEISRHFDAAPTLTDKRK